MCGGKIVKNNFQADHVLSHAKGGKFTVENCLPSHTICNRYRWFYKAEEFQWILKLGVYLRKEIERGSEIGKIAGDAFVAKDTRREKRRKK